MISFAISFLSPQPIRPGYCWDDLLQFPKSRMKLSASTILEDNADRPGITISSIRQALARNARSDQGKVLADDVVRMNLIG